MGYETPCPIHFSKEEIHRHLEDAEGWNEAQDFWASVSDIMDRDGWTSHENFEQATSIYAEITCELPETSDEPKRMDSQDGNKQTPP